MTNPSDILKTASELYGKRLYWHIRRLVVSHDDAEDVLQETFIRIYTKAGTFRGDGMQLESWCYRIATNEALQLLRKRKGILRSMESLSEELSGMVAAESSPDADKAQVLFQKAVLRLSTEQKIVFNLRYYDDLPYSRIAEITGKSENTLKTNYHYAVEKIKNYLKENSI